MEISVQQLKEKIDNKSGHILIDVREPFEYNEANLDGVLIPLGDLPNALPQLQDHKNDEIIVHCKSGGRSYQAMLFLKQYGFSNVSNLTGGILAWHAKFGK